MKRYQSKKRQEIKGTGLGGEDLSENKQLLEDAERFEESKGRSKADTQKRQSISKTKKERSRNEKKAMERFGETKDEIDTSDKNIVEVVFQKWLLFIHFIRENLEKRR